MAYLAECKKGRASAKPRKSHPHSEKEMVRPTVVVDVCYARNLALSNPDTPGTDFLEENRAPSNQKNVGFENENAAKESPPDGAKECAHSENDTRELYSKSNPNRKEFAAIRYEFIKAANRDKRLTGAARQVLIELATEFARRTDGRCWPSKNTLSKALGLHSKTVQAALRLLRETGWLLIEVGGGPKGSNVFQLRWKRFLEAKKGGASRLQKGERTDTPNQNIEPEKKQTPRTTEAQRRDGRPRKAENRVLNFRKHGSQRTHIALPESSEAKAWKDWCSESGIPFERFPEGTEDKDRGKLCPCRWPPSDRHELKPVISWLRDKGLHP